MASVKDVEKVADDLEGLVGELRSELQNGPDFEKLVEEAAEVAVGREDPIRRVPVLGAHGPSAPVGAKL